jgi:hypothetical protein
MNLATAFSICFLLLVLGGQVVVSSAFCPLSRTGKRSDIRMSETAPTTTAVNPKEFGASHTSFYTDEEKKDSYESLDDVLNAKCHDPQVREVIRDMLDACAEITEALRSALVHVEGSTNDFGDTQLSVDVSTIRFLSFLRGRVLSFCVGAFLTLFDCLFLDDR